MNLIRTFKAVSILFFISTSIPYFLNAQTPDLSGEHEKGHKLTLGLGHITYHKSEETDHIKNTTLGAYIFNYEYLLNSHWSVGLHNDLVIEDIKELEHDGKEVIEHERPVASKLVGAYKPGKHTTFMVGLGDEFANHKNILLSTVGLDYGFHLKGGWEIGGEFSYDFKFRNDDSWIMGLGLSKHIFTKHHH